MTIQFTKYHGTGNDFIMIDARAFIATIFTEEFVRELCDRHLGIGADGLILLMKDAQLDFRMKYFNSNGREGTMCGNGGRCITAFAKNLGIIKEKAVFCGIDGLHESVINENGHISLKMIDVNDIKVLDDGFLIDTGSMHFVSFHKDLSSLDVYSEGKEIRHQARFGSEGTNVNFVQIISDHELKIRTYERGVENETLSCGTGSVAAAISAYLRTNTDKNSYLIHAPGGDLNVSFNSANREYFTNIWLKGPAEFVFKGEIENVKM